MNNRVPEIIQNIANSAAAKWKTPNERLAAIQILEDTKKYIENVLGKIKDI